MWNTPPKSCSFEHVFFSAKLGEKIQKPLPEFSPNVETIKQRWKKRYVFITERTNEDGCARKVKLTFSKKQTNKNKVYTRAYWMRWIHGATAKSCFESALSHPNT